MGAFHIPLGPLAVFFLFALAILATVLAKQRSGGAVGFPYQAAKALFSPAERSFLGVLEQAVGPENRVFGKVRVADIATVRPGLGAAARHGALNRIALKHFDFVVCRTSDLSVLCVVELNDGSHNTKRAQERDSFVIGVCKVINLPLLAIRAKHAYSAAKLREQFLAATTTQPTELTPMTARSQD